MNREEILGRCSTALQSITSAIAAIDTTHPTALDVARDMLGSTLRLAIAGEPVEVEVDDAAITSTEAGIEILGVLVVDCDELPGGLVPRVVRLEPASAEQAKIADAVRSWQLAIRTIEAAAEAIRPHNPAALGAYGGSIIDQALRANEPEAKVAGLRSEVAAFDIAAEFLAALDDLKGAAE